MIWGNQLQIDHQNTQLPLIFLIFAWVGFASDAIEATYFPFGENSGFGKFPAAISAIAPSIFHDETFCIRPKISGDGLPNICQLFTGF
ncbi:MAG: hypothetical protein R3C26_07925 [Calditrichia bacterium]